ncbi:hypothetical protein GCM10027160_35500 [Streptomyces calidiresistens]
MDGAGGRELWTSAPGGPVIEHFPLSREGRDGPRGDREALRRGLSRPIRGSRRPAAPSSPGEIPRRAVPKPAAGKPTFGRVVRVTGLTGWSGRGIGGPGEAGDGTGCHAPDGLGDIPVGVRGAAPPALPGILRTVPSHPAGAAR